MISKRWIALAFSTVLTLSLCAGPPAAGGEELRVVDVALTAIEKEYIELPDFGRIRLGALQGLLRAVSDPRLRIEGSPDAPVLVAQAPGASPDRLHFTPAPDRAAILRDLTAALAAVRHLRPDADLDRLEQAMVAGAVEGLDRHSTFLTREAEADLLQAEPPRVVGVGVQISDRDGQLIVVAPISGGPADRLGVRPGDRLVRVDGKPTAGMSPVEAVRRLSGPVGSRVSFTVVRQGHADPLEFVAVREVVRGQTVSARAIEPGIGYIRLQRFREDTHRELQQALAGFQQSSGLTGLLLDLRDNPGGPLGVAVNVAEQLLPAGSLVVSTQGRARSGNLRLVAQAKQPLTDTPLVVLVNGGSAGSAEIVAAALQDHRRGVVVGHRTSGRGRSQSIVLLPDGSTLRLTTTRLVTPSGRTFDGTGLTPDVLIDGGSGAAHPSPETDTELRRALDVLRGAMLGRNQ